MDVKNAFLYETIEEEVYVCQPSGFEDPDHPDKVYKVVKALYGLHQAPKAWYETLATYLLENGFHRGKIDQTLFIKKKKGDILLVYIYVDDIIFGATNKNLCKSFEKLIKDKFQMSLMRELTLFLGKSASTPIDTEKPLLKDPDGEDVDVHIYRSMIGFLMYLTSSRPGIMFAKFGLTEGKSASTPIDTEKPLLKDHDGEDVDVHIYRSMIGFLMYLTSSRPDIMFANQLSDLSTHSTKYISPALTQKVFANMKRVGKGCSGVETPLFEGMLVAREPEEQGDVEEQGNEEEQGTADTTTEEPETAVLDDAADDQPIPSPAPLTPPPQQPQDRVDTFDDTLMEDVSNQRREFNRAEDVVKETKEVREFTADTQVEGRQADIYHIDIDHVAKVLNMQEDESEVQEAVEVVTTTKLITEVVAAISETVSAAAVIPSVVPKIISVAAIPTVTAPSIKVVAPVKAIVPSTRRKR
nr:hypothetical protein [Tanacetum cinerariifolium]